MDILISSPKQQLPSVRNVCSEKKNTKRSSVLLLRLVFFFFGTDVIIGDFALKVAFVRIAFRHQSKTKPLKIVKLKIEKP